MTLRELEIFYYLSEDAHISELSKKIGISQSAISLALKSLEEKLTEPLFDRVGKKLLLNERGRTFKERTYKHFLALQDAQELFKQNKLSGLLKIASSRTIGAFIIPQIVFDFLSSNPEIKIEKRTDNSAEVVKSVLVGEVDIGFIESAIQESHLFKQRVAHDTLIVVTADKALAGREFYIDELFSKKWLLREKGSGTREIFLQNLGSLAKKIDIYMEFVEFVEIKALLLQNKEAISCISRFSVEQELAQEELFEVKIKNISFERELYMVHHKKKYKTRLFEEFRKFALQEFQKI